MLVFDLVFTAPSGQPPVTGPSYYSELRSVPYAQKHTLFYAIGPYCYEAVVIAAYSCYYGRVIGVRYFHVESLEQNLRMLYPKISLRRIEQYHLAQRN